MYLFSSSRERKLLTSEVKIFSLTGDFNARSVIQQRGAIYFQVLYEKGRELFLTPLSSVFAQGFSDNHLGKLVGELCHLPFYFLRDLNCSKGALTNVAHVFRRSLRKFEGKFRPRFVEAYQVFSPPPSLRLLFPY